MESEHPATRAERHALAADVDAEALQRALRSLAHAGIAPIVEVTIEGSASARTLVVRERMVEGEALADEPTSKLTDKVIALGTELVPMLTALAEAGIAHGRVDARQVLRREDGSLCLTGVAGVRADGQRARGDDDVSALATLMLSLLSPRAPASTRLSLEQLVAEPVAVSELQRRLFAIRAAIPIAPGRQVRSIKRLAFPPPLSLPRKSKRYLLRLLLVAGIVALGLFAAFNAPDTTPAPAPATRPAPIHRPDGAVYIRLPPLPHKTPSPQGP